MSELISVIVPVYKVEKYLDECVSSILSQTYNNIEVILVDDGSPDNCPAMCDEWAKRDSRVRVIHKSNGGLSDARNAGIDASTGKYLMFIDSDDYIKSEMIEVMHSQLLEEDADICACNLYAYNEDGGKIVGSLKRTVGDSETILKMIYDQTAYSVAACGKLYRRKMFDTVRFPVGKLYEDTFTTYRLTDKAKRIVKIPDALYCYRIRPESIMTSGFSKRSMQEEEAWRCNYQFMEKNYPSVKKAAFSFYLQKVVMLAGGVPGKGRGEFSEEYNYLKKIVEKNYFYILFAGKFSLKYRIKFFLDYFKL